MVRALGPVDAEEYHALARRNADHLGRHGDDWPERTMSLDDVTAAFAGFPDASARWGVVLDGAIVGRVDVVHRKPPRWGFGYWLSEAVTGRGLMTAACRAALAHARDELGAVEVFAGVTHGNEASVAVLRRCGFAEVAHFDGYTRYGVTLVDRATG